MWLLAVLACGRAGAPVAPAPVGHYADFPMLVDVAARGDRESTARLARELAGAEGEELAGGLGFLAAAEVGELADGVAGVGTACGRCHQERGVAAPASPPWAHRTAARAAVHRLVWPGHARDPLDVQDAAAETVGAAWARAEPADTAAPGAVGLRRRAAAALRACAECHAGSR